MVLGKRRISFGHGRRRRKRIKTDTYMYVPVLKTLEAILQDSKTCSEVSHSK